MQNKNHWYRNIRFKLFAILCAIAVLTSVVFVNRSAQALSADGPSSQSDMRKMSIVSWSSGRLDIFSIKFLPNRVIWVKTFNGSWSAWRALPQPPDAYGFLTVDAVAVPVASPPRIEVFGTDRDSNLWQSVTTDGTNYTAWQKIGTGQQFWDGVQAVAGGSRSATFDIFTVTNGTDYGAGGPMQHRSCCNPNWYPANGWETLDSAVPTRLSVASWGPNRVDLVKMSWTPNDGNSSNDYWINHRYWNGSSWSAWTANSVLAGLTYKMPSLVSWGPNRLDVFVRGTDNAIYHKYYNGTSWVSGGWEYLAGAGGIAGPTSVSWGSGRLDIFQNEHGTITHKSWQNGWWPAAGDPWESLGPAGTSNDYDPNYSSPEVVSWGANRLDLFWRAPFEDSPIYHKWWDGSNWGPSQTGAWEVLGAP